MFSHNDLVLIGHALNQGAFTVRGEEITFESGFIPSEKEMTDALLATKKSEAIDDIDTFYEAKRQSYLTAGATQALVYIGKYNEAKAYKENPVGNFPLLQASMGIEGDNLGDISTYILGKASQMGAMAAGFEKERLTKKKQIREAETIEELDALLE